jgi:hypothetical protein
MVEHRELGTWCDAAADQQTETVGQQPVALHPPVVVTAQPDQTGQREPGRIPKRASPAARQRGERRVYTGNTGIGSGRAKEAVCRSLARRSGPGSTGDGSGGALTVAADVQRLTDE